ncbi:MAG: hypothetical protein HC860_09265 [Alkalinema sp. RU_4_3]|nr:hypothetical protein [Alkalinema sp. RU_4_3]
MIPAIFTGGDPQELDRPLSIARLGKLDALGGTDPMEFPVTEGALEAAATGCGSKGRSQGTGGIVAQGAAPGDAFAPEFFGLLLESGLVEADLLDGDGDHQTLDGFAPGFEGFAAVEGVAADQGEFVAVELGQE